MAVSRPELYADLWDAEVKATLAAAEKVAEAKRYNVAQEGKSHPLWLIGHLANTNNLLIGMWCCENDSMLAKEYGKKFAPDFAGGDPIVTDPDNYPAWDEVLAQYKAVGDACGKGIRALPEEDLDKPLRGGAPENMQKMFGSIENAIRTMIRHEAHHRGQLAMLAALD